MSDPQDDQRFLEEMAARELTDTWRFNKPTDSFVYLSGAERDRLVSLARQSAPAPTCATCRFWSSHSNVDGKPVGNGACSIGVTVNGPYTPFRFGCNQHHPAGTP